MTEAELIDLQTKYSHHEVEIEALKKAVYEQSLALAALEKNLKILREHIEADHKVGPADEKPPHY
jgi:uncharacterized coiled-coil protein SlyX